MLCPVGIKFNKIAVNFDSKNPHQLHIIMLAPAVYQKLYSGKNWQNFDIAIFGWKILDLLWKNFKPNKL
jgi:hypothetical protein